MNERKKWLGGYVRIDARRRNVFVIERWVGGKKFHISTRCHAERQALEHLARFEADPTSYSPGGTLPEGIFISEALIGEHCTWSVDTRGNTRKHANQVKRFLEDWLEELDGRDLRKLSLHDLRTELARWKTAKAYRIASLKSFFGWLRKERGLLRHAEDVTLDLPVPQAVPEKRRRTKAVTTKALNETLTHLRVAGKNRVYDCLFVLAHTGWHVTELWRFAHGTDPRDIEETPGHSKAVAVLTMMHKGGRRHRTSVASLEVLAAAKRVREAGTIPKGFSAKVRAAAIACGHDFGPGVMRHTVSTRLAERDDWSMDAVGDYLGHQDKRTTANFYADVAIPRAPDLPVLH